MGEVKHHIVSRLSNSIRSRGMKLASSIVALVLAGALTACGSDDSSKKVVASATFTDTAMQSILTNKCSIPTCHVSGGQSTNFASMTEAEVKAHTSIRDRAAAGTMPPSGYTGLSATEKATIVNFYK
jgi:hypothetical protein